MLVANCAHQPANPGEKLFYRTGTKRGRRHGRKNHEAVDARPRTGWSWTTKKQAHRAENERPIGQIPGNLAAPGPLRHLESHDSKRGHTGSGWRGDHGTTPNGGYALRSRLKNWNGATPNHALRHAGENTNHKERRQANKAPNLLASGQHGARTAPLLLLKV